MVYGGARGVLSGFVNSPPEASVPATRIGQQDYDMPIQDSQDVQVAAPAGTPVRRQRGRSLVTRNHVRNELSGSGTVRAEATGVTGVPSDGEEPFIRGNRFTSVGCLSLSRKVFVVSIKEGFERKGGLYVRSHVHSLLQRVWGYTGAQGGTEHVEVCVQMLSDLYRSL